MADIEMTNPGVLGSQSPESTVQSGGGGTIDMYGTTLPLSQSPVSSVQTGKGMGAIEMVGEQGLLNKTPVTLHGEVSPKDKGE